jgi:hypothetical protein
MASFQQRATELQRIVGTGQLEVQVKVSQVYAHFQETSGRDDPRIHKHPFSHPRGGKEFFLRDLIQARGHGELRDWVRRIFEHSTPVEGAKTTVDEMVKGVFELAPRETGDLRRSASGKVFDNHRLAHDRPADVPRIPEAALKARRRRR